MEQAIDDLSSKLRELTQVELQNQQLQVGFACCKSSRKCLASHLRPASLAMVQYLILQLSIH